jgi:small subunit ribosomal protein S20
MPNTKSAERRARSNARKHLHNHSVKSELKTLEKRYLGTLSAGGKDQSSTSFRTICSALDKAAKSGIIHKATANRKKSRLAIRLLRAGSAAAAPATAPAPAPAS